MKSARPVFLNLLKIRFPIMAWVSILHRLSGIFLFITIPVLLWVLQCSFLANAQWESLCHVFQLPMVKLLFGLIIFGLFYHTLAGLRHLWMDCRSTNSLRFTRITAWSVMGIAIVFLGWMIYRWH